MTAKRNTILVCILASVLMAGCTAFQQSLTGEEKTLLATSKDDVKVFLSSQTLPRPYKEVGTIVVTLSSEDAAVAFLKEKAAAMGADALMNCEVRVHTAVLVILVFPIPIHSYVATAVAVKYTNEN
jgi:hypothetical protein